MRCSSSTELKPTSASSKTKSSQSEAVLSIGNKDRLTPASALAAVVACSNSVGVGPECGGGAGSCLEVLESLQNCPENNNNFEEESKSSSSSSSGESSDNKICTKMFGCRVLLVLLLVKCLLLSFIIPAHLIPAGNGNGNDYPAPAPPDYGEEDGFDNHIMLDAPLPLELQNEILNLVDDFDIPSQPASAPDHVGNGNGNGNGVEDPPPATADSNSLSNEVNGGGGGDPEPEPAPATGDDNDDDAGENTEAHNESGGGNGGNGGNGNGGNGGDGDDGDKDSDVGGESQGEDAGEAESSSSDTSESAATASSSSGDSGSTNGNGGGGGSSSCSNDATMQTVLEKLESLMGAVKNIDSSIDKMETLVQSTMIDERVYKCMSAIQNGNQTQALKYWKQILRYVSTPQKQAAILNQLIRDSYSGSPEQILPVIQFIEQTTQFYGFHTLYKELPKYNHLYRHTAVFTLGHHIKKSCGRESAIYKSLPSAVQNVFADFFTLQNKHNKGYLYYAKRCVAKHYFHCLDVLTKRIDPYVLDGLADDSEEKKRYHWKLNATDSTVTKFYILNHDKYWTYRLQDLNNSPRFKMEEAGSNAEIELAHFQLRLNSDEEIMIQVRDSEDYLEEEDFKNDKSEVRLHSFHQADGIPDSPRMYWLVNPVGSNGETMEEPESCSLELAAVPPSNNGNGSSK